MRYAEVSDVERGYKTLDSDDKEKAEALLEEAAVMILSKCKEPDEDVAKVVSCRMVRRALASNDADIYPMGATQGTMTAGSYSQSWTVSNGSTGELYLSKTEKDMLGIGNKLGVSNPYGGMA